MSIESGKQTTAPVRSRRLSRRTFTLLRVIAFVIIILGTLGSAGFVLREGQRTPPLLLLLFIGWVLSPLLAYAIANRYSKRWSMLTRTVLYGGMVLLALGSLAVYSFFSLRPHVKTPTAVFLLVPLSLWFLLDIVYTLAQFIFEGVSRSKKGPQ